MRKLVRSLLQLAGYDLTSTSRWGMAPMRDLQRILGSDASTVLDVGANHGQAAQRFLNAFPRASVYSFEPLPQALVTLRDLAASHPRLHIVPIALGEAASRLPLNIASADDGSSLLPFQNPGQHRWTDPAGIVEVEVQRLDALATELAIQSADLLKVDTQGFDLNVLKGAGEMLQPSRIRAVMVELNFAPFYTGQSSAGEVIDFLTRRGYRPVGFFSGERLEGGQQTWADGLFA